MRKYRISYKPGGRASSLPTVVEAEEYRQSGKFFDFIVYEPRDDLSFTEEALKLVDGGRGATRTVVLHKIAADGVVHIEDVTAQDQAPQG